MTESKEEQTASDIIENQAIVLEQRNNMLQKLDFKGTVQGVEKPSKCKKIRHQEKCVERCKLTRLSQTMKSKSEG